MVEGRIEDGRRIAQLLASELTGRESGVLGSLSVVDADSDAEPTADGAVAYGIDCDDERLATVRIFPAEAAVEFAAGAATPDTDGALDVEERPGLRRGPSGGDDTDLVVVVEYGAAVKAAVDVLAAAAEAERDR